jgi:MazG family protein
MSGEAPRSLDALVAAAGVDPADGLQVVAADRLPGVAFDPSAPLLVLAGAPRPGAEPAVLPGRHARRDGVAVLRALYPDDHGLVRLADGAAATIGTIEDGAFDLTDVYRSIAGKIVRRHPHVFGGLEVDGEQQVLANWETIKAGERAERGKADEGAFGGVARALPALAGSREIQERAANLGWDWDAIAGVWAKVGEELDELRAAATDDERLHELGDTLFAIVNLARWMKLDPEEALRAANHRWVARYRRVEGLAAERGLNLDAMSLAEKDVLWDEVKHR